MASKKGRKATTGRRTRRTSGGRAGGGGFDYQARVIAYVAAHALARRKIGWLGNRGSDVPEAIAAETDGPGDDIGIELANTTTRLEVQVKRGLSGKVKLIGALQTFIERLLPGASTEGILVVDPHTPAAISRDLREDLGRIRDGRTDSLRDMAQAVLEALTRAGATHLARQLEVVSVAVDARSDADRKFAVSLLMQLLGDEDLAEQAFDALVADGHLLIRHKGRRTRQGLEAILRSKGWQLGPVGGPGSVGDLAKRLGLGSTADPRVATGVAVAGDVTRDAEGTPTATSPPADDATWKAELDRARGLLRRGHPASALALLRALEVDMLAAAGLTVKVAGAATGVEPTTTAASVASAASTPAASGAASSGAADDAAAGNAVEIAPAAAARTAPAAATWHRLYANLGAALYHLGRYPEARAMFEEARTRMPAHAGTLTNLARVAYLLDDHVTAERLAHRALGVNASEAGAWAVLLDLGVVEAEVYESATAPGGADAPPAEVHMSTEFQVGIAAAAMRRGDYAKAAAVLRSTLHDERPADRLYLLAYALLAPLQVPMRLAGPPDPRLSEVDALTTEALANLPGDEYSTLLEQVLLLRGSVRRSLGDLGGAAEDAQKALQLHPEASPGRWRSACLYAAVRLDQERPEEVLGVLNLVATGDRPPRFHVMRARAFAALNRPDETRRAIDDAFSAAEQTPDGKVADVEPEPPWVRALTCVEIALEAGLVAQAVTLFNAHVPVDAGWLRTLFAGRIAIARGDDATGLEQLRAAAEQTHDSARPRVYFELASRLGRLGRFPEAIEAYEAGDAWTFGDEVRPGYIAALMEAGRHDRAGELLEALEEESRRNNVPFPTWAFPAAAAIADMRADLPAAAEYLARLVAARPQSVNAHLRLAHVHMRSGDLEAARPVVRALSGRPELGSRDRMILASLLFTIGDHSLAVQEAYHALRAAAGDPDAHEIQMGYVHLMIQAERVGALDVPTAVGSDVQVTLRRMVGRGRRTIRVLREAPVDAARNEFLQDDPMVSPLIGLAKGALVELPGEIGRRATAASGSSAAPHRYRIATLRSLPGLEYGRLVRTLISPSTGESGARAIPLGEEGTVGHLMPLLHELHAMDAREAEVFARYDEHHGLPLGTIARFLGRPLHEAYILRLQRGERLYTELGDGESLKRSVAAAASTTPIVLTRSALVTAQLLKPHGVDLLAMIERLGRQILAPQSLLDELEAERRELQLAVRQGASRLGIGPAGFATSETPSELVARQEEQLLQLITWVRRASAVPVRSLVALSPAATQPTELLGLSSVDALDAAGSRMATLYADDLGLRRFESAFVVGSRSFSTWALVTAASQRGLLEPRQARQAIAAVVGLHHYFVPLSGDLLAGLVSDEGHQITASTRLVFQRLADSTIDLERAVEVAAQTLRNVALSGLGASALGEVTQACLLALAEQRSITRVRNVLVRRVRELFFLMPDQPLREVFERVAKFELTKHLAGSLQ